MRSEQETLELYEELFADLEDIVRSQWANRDPSAPRRWVVVCADKASGRMWLEDFIEAE